MKRDQTNGICVTLIHFRARQACAIVIALVLRNVDLYWISHDNQT